MSESFGSDDTPLISADDDVVMVVFSGPFFTFAFCTQQTTKLLATFFNENCTSKHV